ncbi:hypothetical protein HK405_010541, partial [Cladochytrium tenue]
MTVPASSTPAITADTDGLMRCPYKKIDWVTGELAAELDRQAQAIAKYSPQSGFLAAIDGTPLILGSNYSPDGRYYIGVKTFDTWDKTQIPNSFEIIAGHNSTTSGYTIHGSQPAELAPISQSTPQQPYERFKCISSELSAELGGIQVEWSTHIWANGVPLLLGDGWDETGCGVRRCCNADLLALLRIIAETEALRTASLTADTGVVFHQGSSTHSSSSMSQSQQQQPSPPPPPPRSLPAHSQSDFYRILLASDILKFVFVFAIEVYKAATSFDPTNQPGALPISNNSFQHVLDSIKMCIMVGNLLLPSGIAKVVKRSSGGSSGAGSKAATAGRAVAAAAPSSSRSDGASTSVPAAKLEVWGKSPAPAVTTTTAARPPSPPFAAQAGYGHPTKSSGRGGVRRSGSVGDALELYSMSAVDSNTLPGNGSTVDGCSGFGGKGNSTRPTSLSMPATTQTDGLHRYPAYQIPAQRGIYGDSRPASGHAGYAGGSGTILPVALEQHRDRGLGRGHGGAYAGS